MSQVCLDPPATLEQWAPLDPEDLWDAMASPAPSADMATPDLAGQVVTMAYRAPVDHKALLAILDTQATGCRCRTHSKVMTLGCRWTRLTGKRKISMNLSMRLGKS